MMYGKYQNQKSVAKNQRQISALASVSGALPALKRAQKLQKRAASSGFDWPDITPVFEKIDEEVTELCDAILEQDQAHIEEEMGDLLFACVNLSRHLAVDAEEALRKSNQKFIRRFEYIEQALSLNNEKMHECSLHELETLWCEAKKSLSTKNHPVAS